jgi:hypothetical protein
MSALDQVQDQTDQTAEADAGPSVEDRARDMGWAPKDDWRGDPDKWVDAGEFVRRADEVLPIVRAEKKKLEASLTKAKEEIAEMRSTFKEFKKHHSETQQRAYERAMKDLQARQAEAVEAGDIKAVRETTKEIVDLTQGMKPDEKDADPYDTPEHQRTLAAWKAENAWFESDRAMTGAAAAIAAELEDKGVRGAEQLAEIAKRIRAEFPHKFQNERRAAAAAVEGTPAPARKPGKTWADLPSEAKSFAERMVKQGLMTREQYVKDFFG